MKNGRLIDEARFKMRAKKSKRAPLNGITLIGVSLLAVFVSFFVVGLFLGLIVGGVVYALLASYNRRAVSRRLKALEKYAKFYD